MQKNHLIMNDAAEIAHEVWAPRPNYVETGWVVPNECAHAIIELKNHRGDTYAQYVDNFNELVSIVTSLRNNFDDPRRLRVLTWDDIQQHYNATGEAQSRQFLAWKRGVKLFFVEQINNGNAQRDERTGLFSPHPQRNRNMRFATICKLHMFEFLGMDPIRDTRYDSD